MLSATLVIYQKREEGNEEQNFLKSFLAFTRFHQFPLKLSES